jgi:hypothetical protein
METEQQPNPDLQTRSDSPLRSAPTAMHLVVEPAEAADPLDTARATAMVDIAFPVASAHSAEELCATYRSIGLATMQLWLSGQQAPSDPLPELTTEQMAGISAVPTGLFFHVGDDGGRVLRENKAVDNLEGFEPKGAVKTAGAAEFDESQELRTMAAAMPSDAWNASSEGDAPKVRELRSFVSLSEPDSVCRLSAREPRHRVTLVPVRRFCVGVVHATVALSAVGRQVWAELRFIHGTDTAAADVHVMPLATLQGCRNVHVSRSGALVVHFTNGATIAPEPCTLELLREIFDFVHSEPVRQLQAQQRAPPPLVVPTPTVDHSVADSGSGAGSPRSEASAVAPAPTFVRSLLGRLGIVV